jgi:hypothetical protein
MTVRQRGYAVLFSVSAIGYFPFAEWLATSRVAASCFVAEPFYSLRLLIFFLLIPGLALTFCFLRSRPGAIELVLFAVLYFACCLTGIRLSHQTRMIGMRDFTIRAKPLVAAIHQYERDHHTPPESLRDLVPEYLPAIPTTGMGAYPEFQYLTGANCRHWYLDNPWMLSVSTSIGFMNWDRILFFPRQNYPERGFSGTLERVDDWAYVHE